MKDEKNQTDNYSFYLDNNEDNDDKKEETVEAVETEATEENDESFGFTSFATYVGAMLGAVLSAVFRFIVSLFKSIWKGIKTSAKFIYSKIDKFILTSVKAFHEEWVFFRSEVKGVRAKIRENMRKSPIAFFKILNHYIAVAIKRHPHMFSKAANVVLPILGLIVLVGTINHWSTSTFALQVESGGQEIGYVENESVFVEAQSLVKERFDSDVTSSKEDVDLKAKYKVVTVDANELTDSETISDNIVENSKGDSVYACGVYIDGEFICALESETDATQVFNNILDGYSTDDENAVVGFVEDVQYVQGLYPDSEDVVWDSQKLSDKLKTTKSEAKYYTVETGDTVSQIANANGLKTSELFDLNPGLTETIKVGDQILVSHEVNYVRLKVVKTEVTTQEIAFNTVKTNNSNLYKGTTKTTQKGVKGLDRVTSLVTYVDGVRVSSEEIGRETLRAPVDEKIDIGTKKATRYYGSGGGYTSSSYVKGNGSMIWPAVGCYVVTQAYGNRGYGFHLGMDIAGGNAYGKTVVAAASGTVVSAGYSGSYGYRVVISHGNGLTTTYAHMIAGSICVSPGQYVSAGSAIGKVGSTGNSTGPHLHFEVRINGSTVNPAPYIGA
ncbi:MAG: peptidoglycan DD-metalloendopeptidase family protein [Clostridia bacterium]|nr:peptidoglycan DD-metalloendopeptidase family protein [Clostridia bacterium]